VLAATLSPEPEADARAADPCVPIAQRGQPERAVQPGVLVVADPDQGQLEQPHDGRQDLLARQAGLRQVRVAALADLAERSGKGDHPVELRLVALLVPARVVAMLLAPAGVAPGRLDVADRAGADPHVRPRRRDGERADAGQRGGIGHPAALGVEVGEATAGAAAADAGPVVRAVAQPRVARDLARIVSLRR
jgi:hypothetical protein